ncbi:MAG: hypothetical protein A4E43_01396 [Methanosaeta sp. PtaB.Bin005]|nr:MAG: hypothetical protein A4E43_01396 [Methanosaeta sp. PtaB.Bin005]
MLVWHSESISKDNNMGSEFKKARVNYPSLKGWACSSAKSRATMGILTDTLAAIFRAAIVSAGPEKPQQTHENSSLVGRLDRDIR